MRRGEGVNARKRKLIEVALPLDAINKASAREKSIRHGHPSTLHLWWSRKPLAACRAVLWASLVDDPSAHPEQFPTEKDQDAERKRLFRILADLVVWENSSNPDVLGEARVEVERCFPDGPPAVLDPFAGGGSIPLEAQRLGLKALAGDLNPVAVLINRAMVEVPPRFAGRPPVHPEERRHLDEYGTRGHLGDGSSRDHMAVETHLDAHGSRGHLGDPEASRSPTSGQSSVSASTGTPSSGAGNGLGAWNKAQGLAADIRAYGAWMKQEAERRIGHLYPDAVGPDGEKLTPIAWLWARTVRSPDPAWDGHVPLVSSWALCKKKGRPEVWVAPMVDRVTQTINYRVDYGERGAEERGAGGRGSVERERERERERGKPSSPCDKARQRHLHCHRGGDSS